MTSVDLMTAMTCLPCVSFMCSTEPRVMTETTSCPPMSSTTSAITAPNVIDLMVPLSWFRALSSIVHAPFISYPRLPPLGLRGGFRKLRHDLRRKQLQRLPEQRRRQLPEERRQQ